MLELLTVRLWSFVHCVGVALINDLPADKGVLDGR